MILDENNPKNQRNPQTSVPENLSLNSKIEAAEVRETITRKSADLRIIDFAAELERLDRTFRANAKKYKLAWQRRAVLDWEAASYKLPKAEFRKLFLLWLENQSNI